jgi:hypothetical protein
MRGAMEGLVDDTLGALCECRSRDMDKLREELRQILDAPEPLASWQKRHQTNRPESLRMISSHVSRVLMEDSFNDEVDEGDEDQDLVRRK